MHQTPARPSAARLSSELDRARAREAATREILEVISRSRDDEGPVFDAVLRNARRLCGASAAGLLLGRRDEAALRLAALQMADSEPRDVTEARVAEINRIPMQMDPTQHVSAQAICSGEIVHIADLRQTPSYRSGERTFRIMVEEQGHRTTLSVPLLDALGALGAINLHRSEVRPFSEDDIALIRSLAAQAVIAIENVRQFRELQARLDREKASADILELISQSRDDDRPVFDAILHRAANLCNAHTAALVMGAAGDTHQRMIASYGADPDTVALYGRGEVPMDPDTSFAARAILTGKVVHVEDMMDTDLYRRGVRRTVSTVRDSGMRTTLFVPLVTGTGSLGAINIHRKEVRPFTADEIALVETFAAQAVIAIENGRQFRELQTRLEREKASAEILEVISQSRHDEGPVFAMILRNVARLCGTKLTTLSRINTERTHLELAAHWGKPLKSFHVGEDRWSLDSRLQIVQSVREARAIHIPDLADTDLYRRGDPDRVRLVEEEGVRSSLTVPMITVDRVAIGCLGLYRHDLQPFTPDHIALVETFAAQAVIAIENVRQFRALEALNAELGDRVQDQVGEIERMGRLKRFLPAAVADAVVTSGSEKLLSSHRALLGVLFCDIRGFTAFCETAEPEETIEVLQTYHEEMGRLINAHGAGVDHRMGDGIMVLFNDPLPCDDPAAAAVRLALGMRDRMAELCAGWKRMGHRLGFGVGISLGYATVGMVGSGGRFDYTASGTAVNLAARLCDEAQDGEILVSPRARTAIEDQWQVESRGECTLKGIREPVELFRVVGVALS